MSEVIFIGTSDAFGAGGRRQSALLLRSSPGSVLIDCGTTTNSGFAELGLERNEVDAIVISHFHADHFGGVPLFVLASRYLDHRTSPLVIAGPPVSPAVVGIGRQHRHRASSAALAVASRVRTRQET